MSIESFDGTEPIEKRELFVLEHDGVFILATRNRAYAEERVHAPEDRVVRYVPETEK